MKRRNRTLLLVCAIALGIGTWWSIRVYRRYQDWSYDAYGSMSVGMWIVDHLEATGEWPKGWNDLRPWYSKRTASSGDDEYWAEVQRRIEVDWGADPGELVKADEEDRPPFNVVCCRSGRIGGPTLDHEPNLTILRYLKFRASQGRRPPSGPATQPTVPAD